jgi:hypothetical protein
MAQFLALYVGTPERGREWDALDEATRNKRVREGMAAWHAWGDKHQGSIVVQGGPVGKTKSAGPGGVSDISNQVGGFIIVEAADHAAAAKLFENHPHFAIMPGSAVEVMPILPIPQMPPG